MYECTNQVVKIHLPVRTIKSRLRNHSRMNDNDNDANRLDSSTDPPKSHPRLLLRVPRRSNARVNAEGHFTPVATATPREKARLFAQQVAKAHLIQKEKEEQDEHEHEHEHEHVNKQQQQQQQKIHPLTRASAHLRSQCLAELSKAVNLSGLVLGGAYMQLQYVVQADDDSHGPDTTKLTSASERNTNTNTNTHTNRNKEDIIIITRKDKEIPTPGAPMDALLRAQFILQRKQNLYTSCRDVLLRHAATCFTATAYYHSLLDRQMLQLRQRGWKLTLPLRHMLDSSKKRRIVSPREIPAFQLNIYHTLYKQQQQQQQQQSQQQHSVPMANYATVEVADDAISKLSNHHHHHPHHHPHPTSTHRRPWKKRRTGSESWSKKEDLHKEDTTTRISSLLLLSSSSPSSSSSPILHVEIHPILSNNSKKQDTRTTYRTLVFQFEDTTDGHIISQQLHLSHSSSTREGQGDNDTDNAQWTLENLQHSLFCTQLFESLRNEVVGRLPLLDQDPSTSLKKPSSLWLSSETGIPTPTHRMMMGSQHNNTVPVPPFTLVYCHPSEFKILFNTQYFFMVTLQECTGIPSMTCPDPIKTRKKDQLILRLLLLHAQSMYHDFRKNVDDERVVLMETTSPRILQSCLGLGIKCFLQDEVRSCLKDIHQWIQSQSHDPDKEFQVVWLPLSLMEYCSQLTISMGSSFCCDVRITCDHIKVTSMTEQGDYHCVDFHSSFELDMYLRLQILKISPVDNHEEIRKEPS